VFSNVRYKFNLEKGFWILVIGHWGSNSKMYWLNVDCDFKILHYLKVPNGFLPCVYVISHHICSSYSLLQECPNNRANANKASTTAPHLTATSTVYWHSVQGKLQLRFRNCHVTQVQIVQPFLFAIAEVYRRKLTSHIRERACTSSLVCTKFDAVAPLDRVSYSLAFAKGN
jgi:hypothetical protein